jgi:hypothetical protein
VKLKPGVRLTDLSPQMALAAVVAESVYRLHGLDPVITSANDSTHGAESLHYAGRALDLRLPSRCAPLPGLPEPTAFDSHLDEAIAAELREALANEFDVVLERHHENRWNWHVHLEFDPK